MVAIWCSASFKAIAPALMSKLEILSDTLSSSGFFAIVQLQVLQSLVAQVCQLKLLALITYVKKPRRFQKEEESTEINHNAIAILTGDPAVIVP